MGVGGSRSMAKGGCQQPAPCLDRAWTGPGRNCRSAPCPRLHSRACLFVHNYVPLVGTEPRRPPGSAHQNHTPVSSSGSRAPRSPLGSSLRKNPLPLASVPGLLFLTVTYSLSHPPSPAPSHPGGPRGLRLGQAWCKEGNKIPTEDEVGFLNWTAGPLDRWTHEQKVMGLPRVPSKGGGLGFHCRTGDPNITAWNRTVLISLSLLELRPGAEAAAWSHEAAGTGLCLLPAPLTSEGGSGPHGPVLWPL